MLSSAYWTKLTTYKSRSAFPKTMIVDHYYSVCFVLFLYANEINFYLLCFLFILAIIQLKWMLSTRFLKHFALQLLLKCSVSAVYSIESSLTQSGWTIKQNIYHPLLISFVCSADVKGIVHHLPLWLNETHILKRITLFYSIQCTHFGQT